MPQSPRSLKHVMPGQVITAETWNRMVDAINALASGGDQYGRHVEVFDQRHSIADDAEDGSVLQAVELASLINAFEADSKSAYVLEIDEASEGTAAFVDANENETVEDIADIQGAAYLAGERHMVLADESTGLNYIVPPFVWQLAKLTSDLNPSTDNSATAQIWEWDASAEVVSSLDTVTVKSWGLNETLASGTEVFVLHHRQSRTWYVVSRCPTATSTS